MRISRRVVNLLTTGAFVLSATVASAQVVWNHDPKSDIGPNLWGSDIPLRHLWSGRGIRVR